MNRHTAWHGVVMAATGTRHLKVLATALVKYCVVMSQNYVLGSGSRNPTVVIL